MTWWEEIKKIVNYERQERNAWMKLETDWLIWTKRALLPSIPWAIRRDQNKNARKRRSGNPPALQNKINHVRHCSNSRSSDMDRNYFSLKFHSLFSFLFLEKPIRILIFVIPTWNNLKTDRYEKNIITTGFMFKHKYGAWTRV